MRLHRRCDSEGSSRELMCLARLLQREGQLARFDYHLGPNPGTGPMLTRQRDGDIILRKRTSALVGTNARRQGQHASSCHIGARGARRSHPGPKDPIASDPAPAAVQGVVVMSIQITPGTESGSKVPAVGTAGPGSAREATPQEPFGPSSKVSLSKTARDSAAGRSDPSGTGPEPLSEGERREVQELRKRDQEVRAHEQAHKGAGGGLAGAVHLEYERGPDGARYAVGGHVGIDVSPVEGDPKATLQKMAQVRRAALAPADPSSADRQVAARAAGHASQARAELAQSEPDSASQTNHPTPGRVVQ